LELLRDQVQLDNIRQIRLGNKAVVSIRKPKVRQYARCHTIKKYTRTVFVLDY